NLWKFIYGPVIFASLDHHDFRSVRVSGFEFACEQGNREQICSSFELLSVADLVSSLASRREESLQGVFRAGVLDRIGQHRQPDLPILILPGMKKMIGCGKGGNIV